MASSLIDLDGYFKRLRYGGSTAPTLETLQQLHRLHAQAIAFENLSSFAGEPVVLDAEVLQAKLVRGGRGGYCFEHNTLLWLVLQQLGFQVGGLAARVLWGASDGVRGARGHMLLRIDIEQQSFIADVGFGGLTLTAPLQLLENQEQTTPHERFRLLLTPAVETTYCLEAQLAAGWAPLYAFDLQPQFAADFEIWNWWTCTHPRSLFVNELMLARPVAGARHALRNNGYSFYPGLGNAAMQQIKTLDRLKTLIRDTFEIELPRSAHLDSRLSSLLRR